MRARRWQWECVDMVSIAVISVAERLKKVRKKRKKRQKPPTDLLPLVRPRLPIPHFVRVGSVRWPTRG